MSGHAAGYRMPWRAGFVYVRGSTMPHAFEKGIIRPRTQQIVLVACDEIRYDANRRAF